MSAQAAISYGSTAASVAAQSAIAAGVMPAALIPIIGPAIVGVTLGLHALFNRKGPKQKTLTTGLVDDLEPQLRANRDAYLEGPRTVEGQAAALQNFDSAWAWLTSNEACGNPGYGKPGQACISDRARGGKHDWFALYRDPISQAAPNSSPQGIQQAIQQSVSGLGWNLAIPAALVGIGLLWSTAE